MRSLLSLLAPDRIDAINASVRGPHRVLVRIRVAEHRRSHWLSSFTTDPAAANPTDNAVWRIPRFGISSGDVKESIEDEMGRELSATLVSDYWQTQSDVLDDISPYKTLLSVERGLGTPLGNYYVPLGVFRVTNVDVSGGSGGQEISINAHSMAWDVADYEFITHPRTGSSHPRLSDIRYQRREHHHQPDPRGVPTDRGECAGTPHRDHRRVGFRFSGKVHPRHRPGPAEAGEGAGRKHQHGGYFQPVEHL